jgi:uncharacterized iron-regulated protein
MAHAEVVTRRRLACLPGVTMLLAASILGAGEPPAGSDADPGAPWTHRSGRDHPLVGRIWDVTDARFIDAPALLARLAAARFLLLGEKHDNADHHRLQAWILRGVIAAGRRPAIAFEMFNADDQPTIDRHLAAAPGDATGIADAVNWKRSGWPDWTMYQPIAAAATNGGVPIVAANLSRADLRALRLGGLGALDAVRVERLGLERPLSPAVRAEMAAEIQEAHCGQASDGVLQRMIDIQRARDARMAEAMSVSGSGRDGAVLIAGAGHVRRDRGAPAHLLAREVSATVLSLAFLEVVEAAVTPAAHAAREARGVLPFDYVWFTPRVDDADPCEKFRRSLGNLGGR